jgi:phosphoribosylformylglycinamidine (FGAM) synthase-like amidotransferase family enzyme
MRGYKLDKRNRISELNSTELLSLTNRACIVLLKSVEKYTTKEGLEKFRKGKTSLLDIGICNGITLLIDKELKTVNKHICILAHDTLNKFKADIKKEF